MCGRGGGRRGGGRRGKEKHDEFQGFSHLQCFVSVLSVYYLSEGFKAHWFTTLVKDSRLTSLLP